MLEPRAALLATPEYHPPLAREQGLRLDFNENLAGCSPRVLQRLRRITAEDLSRYPERAPAEQLVAGRLGLDPELLLLTNGVDEAVHLLCQAYLEAGRQAILVVPTFAMYGVYARTAGAEVIEVAAGEDFRFPVDAVLAACTPHTRLIAVASPNNPTGAAAPPGDLLRLAAAVPQSALLVDEAYFEFCGETLLGQAGRVPNLFVARTFSKAYGLAGLRIGALVGAAEQMRVLRRGASPYSVNAVALAALPAALDDTAFVRAYVNEVLAGRARLEAALRELGIPFWPSRANFVLARFGAARERILAQLRRQSVLVRDRDSDPGCRGCLRMTVGTARDTDRLIAALYQAWPAALEAAR